MLHHLIAILTFFSRERPLSLTDNRMLIISQFLSLSLSLSLFLDTSSPLLRQSDVNNIAISLSLSFFLSLSLSLSLCSWIDHLPFFMISRSLSLHCRRSPIIPFIFRCSLLTREFPWLRYPPGGWNQSCFCSLHLFSRLIPLLLSPSYLSFSPFTALQFFTVPGRDHLRFSDVVSSIGPAVDRNYDVAWRRYALRRIKIGCIHDCTHRPILAAIEHLYFKFQQKNESFDAETKYSCTWISGITFDIASYLQILQKDFALDPFQLTYERK